MDGQAVIDELAKTDAEKPADVPSEVAAKPAPQPQRPVFTDVRRPEGKAATDTKPAASSGAPADVPKTPLATSEDVAKLTDDPAKKLDEHKHHKAEITKPPKPPRQPGVGLAIFATVVIVLGLAALATYAYLQTNGKAPF